MIDLYNKILKDFENNKTSELVSVFYSQCFDDYKELENSAHDLFDKVQNEILTRRKKNEIHLHESMKHQMLTRLLEIKFYSEVDVFNTRRLLAVSSDCVSSIQILIRDELHLNVYFRSSDFDGALPVDLESLSKLPRYLIEHLEYFKDLPEYSECTDINISKLKNLEIKVNLFFGSLHRT